MNPEERFRLISSQNKIKLSEVHKPLPKVSSSSEEWHEEGSSSYSSRTSYSGSDSDDSYFANWEEHVDKNGSLFYAEFNKPCYHAGTTENAYKVMQKNFKKSSSRRNVDKKQSSFMKFLTKDDGDPKDNQEERANSSIASGSTAESPQCDHDIHEIEVQINPENRFKFGPTATLTESLLGVSIAPFPEDPSKLMLAEHMMHSVVLHEKSIKIGDLLLSINNIDVTVHNINEILEMFLEPIKIHLRFKKISQQEQISFKNGMRYLTNFESFVKESNELLKSPRPQYHMHQQIDNELIFSLIILNEEISGLNESTSSSLSNDVIFCYPPPEQNVLYNVRGTFLTLNSILKSEFKSEPLSTTLKVQDTQYNICYMSINKVLILYSISENYSSLKETELRMTEFYQYVQFYYLTIESDMNENVKIDLERICIITIIHLKNNQGLVNFETLLQGSKLLPLPKDAQLRIFDALSEMEAMDYRDWNDEPLISHREFFIYGSALYFRSFLLVSQLPTSQLQSVESFLRCRGIFDFIEAQNVRDLVIWVEIPFPSHSRHFLAISSRNQLLLAVILQAFDPEKRSASDDGVVQEKIIPPSLFYIEEIQETLDHLRHGGIEALARAWITSNKRPQIINHHQNSKRGVETSLMLKHCNLSSEDIQFCASLGGSSAQSLSHSEDSNQKLNDCDSDSDWDELPDSYKSSSGYDMSEITESLLKEVSDVVPTKITAGKENVLLNYIHLDIGNGLILVPPDVSFSSLMNKFHNACHVIHTVLQNTKRFRRLLSQESAKLSAHKNLIAIKEHGILINDDIDFENKFWVIGRLFASPPRELYVCHKFDVPQNLVEIAFRLSFFTTG